MMRFRGGGVGHKATRAAADAFKKDRDELDIECQRDNQVQPEQLQTEAVMEHVDGNDIDLAEAEDEEEESESSEEEDLDDGDCDDDDNEDGQENEVEQLGFAEL